MTRLLAFLLTVSVLAGCSERIGIASDDVATNDATGDIATPTGCTSNQDCNPGQVCAYLPGCSPAARACQTPELSNNLAPYCGCDGQTFQSSDKPPLQPYAHSGACAMDGGSQCPVNALNVQTGVACGAAGAVCMGYSPCALTYLQCTCVATSTGMAWDCGTCGGGSDGGVCDGPTTFDIPQLGIAESICTANETDCTICPQRVNNCDATEYMRISSAGCTCPAPSTQTGSCTEVRGCENTLNAVNRAALVSGPDYACPTTYGFGLGLPAGCTDSPATIQAGTCGQDRVVERNCGTRGFLCVYASGGALKGMASWVDSPQFCGATFPCTQWGSLGDRIACTTVGVRDTCTLGPIDSDAGIPQDAGPGPSCGSTVCAANQVCLHPCSGIPRDGGSAPPPYCVDIPTSCGQGTCDCVRPGACPMPEGQDAGPSGSPTCSDLGAGQLVCNGCA